MKSSIRLNNYFFENVTDIDPTRIEKGETRRMSYGSVKTYHSGIELYDFDIEFAQLSPKKIGYLIYLDNLYKPKDDSEPQNLEFWCDITESELNITFPIDVIIPVGGVDFSVEGGEEETYSAELELWQVSEG